MSKIISPISIIALLVFGVLSSLVYFGAQKNGVDTGASTSQDALPIPSAEISTEPTMPTDPNTIWDKDGVKVTVSGVYRYNIDDGQGKSINFSNGIDGTLTVDRITHTAVIMSFTDSLTGRNREGFILERMSRKMVHVSGETFGGFYLATNNAENGVLITDGHGDCSIVSLDNPKNVQATVTNNKLSGYIASTMFSPDDTTIAFDITTPKANAANLGDTSSALYAVNVSTGVLQSLQTTDYQMTIAWNTNTSFTATRADNIPNPQAFSYDLIDGKWVLRQ